MTAIVEKWKVLWGKVSPVLKKIENVIGVICRCLFRLRKVFMAVPVVYLAVKIAIENGQKLPEMVGLNLQTTGEFAYYVTRDYAVFGPLGVTAFCLLLMFCSRKSLFPWIISIFSLALPYLIWLTNIYPA